jgi:peptidoglycan hydrolase-like protein with peptidoglycan-binding domain
MKSSGIAEIDDLIAGSGAPIGPGSDPKAVVGVQDLLLGHGFGRMPGLRDASHGTFGKATGRAVAAFRKAQGLADGDVVDRDTLLQLVQAPAPTPVVSRPYVTIVLEFDFTSLVKLVSLVAVVEGAGKFAALCLNTDRAGLSVGIIQWAQKPGRLHDLIAAFNTTQAESTAVAFGGQQNVDDALGHTATLHGGVNADGTSADLINFDLIRDPWKARFRNACLDPALQAVQVNAAVASFQQTFAKIDTSMPKITSERQVAFMIDLANQFGDGGAQKLYDSSQAGIDDPIALLGAIRDASVAKLTTLFPTLPQVARAGQDRRDFFIKTDLLADTVFTP